MSYNDALNYLVKKTPVVELYDQLGGRVAVCPEWNGRVMTSTCDGLDGNSFGYVNVQAIDAENFENFGGEDLWTISPLDLSLTIENIKENKTLLQRTLRMADANGQSVEFHLSRSISLLSRQRMGTLFGDAIADALKQEDVSVVAFRTENTVRSQEKACVASRQRGMFNACPHTFIVISTPPENFLSKPPTIDIDYLGGSPHGRIRHIADALLFRADGRGRCRATIPFSAVPPLFGAVELRSGTLTLWMFDVPEESEEKNIIRIYNHGHPHTGGLDWATYYEMNSFSAARELLPEHALSYCQCTLHLNAGNDILGGLVRQIFDVSLDSFPKDVR